MAIFTATTSAGLDTRVFFALEYGIGYTITDEGGTAFRVNYADGTALLITGTGFVYDVVSGRPTGGLVTAGTALNTVGLRFGTFTGAAYSVADLMTTRIGVNGGDVVTAGSGEDFVEITANPYALTDAVIDLGNDASADIARVLWAGAGVPPINPMTVAHANVVISGFDPFDDDILGLRGIVVRNNTSPGAILGWNGSVNPFANIAGGGFLRFRQDGADTVLDIDADGFNGNTYVYVPVVRLVNTTAATLTLENVRPRFDPLGREVNSVTAPTAVGTSNDEIFSVGESTTGAVNIDAGDGNNQILSAGTGAITASAGSGDDVIITGIGNDTINAGDGNNVVNSGVGDDTIIAGNGNNTINAGAGNDSITTGSGSDTIFIGAGNDIVNAGAGDDTIIAGAA
jgi:Ca2+-binding RTX toxin-like protein